MEKNQWQHTVEGDTLGEFKERAFGSLYEALGQQGPALSIKQLNAAKKAMGVYTADAFLYHATALPLHAALHDVLEALEIPGACLPPSLIAVRERLQGVLAALYGDEKA